MPRLRPPRASGAATALALSLVSGRAHAETFEPEPKAPPVDPNPAKLVVDAPSGAEVRVDGILVGSLPLPEPITADPGKHHVIITANGNHPYETDVQLTRGKTVTLYADLESTSQRTLSWILISTGATMVAVGVGFGVASVVEHRLARDIEQGPDDLSPSQQEEFDRAISARDDYRIVSGVMGGAGLATFVTGALFFAFDAPSLPPGTEDSAFTIDPLLSPGFVGAISKLRF